MSAREVIATTLTEIETETMPCPRCKGYGYHGFGKHGHDPDWCEQCHGPGTVMVHDATKTPEILITALRAAGYALVPVKPTEAMKLAAMRAPDGKPESRTPVWCRLADGDADVRAIESAWSAMISASKEQP